MFSVPFLDSVLEYTPENTQDHFENVTNKKMAGHGVEMVVSGQNRLVLMW